MGNGEFNNDNGPLAIAEARLFQNSIRRMMDQAFYTNTNNNNNNSNLYFTSNNNNNNSIAMGMSLEDRREYIANGLLTKVSE
jgi:hypothetical protein